MPIIETLPAYYKPYVSKVEATDVLESLTEKWKDIENLFLGLSEEESNYSYAPGKWTPKQILQHIIDTERILSQRALRFARKDMTQLPGFDHEMYTEVVDVSKRTMDDLWGEFNCVRQSTIYLYKSFSEKELNREGFANGMVISVRNQGFILAGHAIHHTEVIKRRYKTVTEIS